MVALAHLLIRARLRHPAWLPTAAAMPLATRFALRAREYDVWHARGRVSCRRLFASAGFVRREDTYTGIERGGFYSNSIVDWRKENCGCGRRRLPRDEKHCSQSLLLPTSFSP